VRGEFDHATLATVLDRLAAHAGLKDGAAVVIDRGTAYDETYFPHVVG
jgi:hypothetical protein